MLVAEVSEDDEIGETSFVALEFVEDVFEVVFLAVYLIALVEVKLGIWFCYWW